MDLFKYTASVAELNSCKLVSKAEQLVRQYVTAVTDNTSLVDVWGSSSATYLETKLYYKLLTLALNTHSKLSKATLPDKLYVAKNKAQDSILHSILTSSPNSSYRRHIDFQAHISYEEFIDIFEFDTLIELPFYTHYIERLDAIIGPNPVHFKVKWNCSIDYFERHSTDLPKDLQYLAYAVRYKQVNYPNEPRTIWDAFLDYCTVPHIDTPEGIELTESYKQRIAESVTKLEQHIKALNTIKDTL